MKLSPFIAGAFGIVGFVLATLAGLTADNTFETILWKAMMCAGVCYVVGYGVGLICEQVAREHGVAIAKKVAEADTAEELKRNEALAKQAEEEKAQTSEALMAEIAPPVKV